MSGKTQKWIGTLTRAELALWAEVQVYMMYEEIIDFIKEEKK